MSDIQNKQNDWKDREVGALWKKSNSKGSFCTGYIVSDELGNKVKQRVIMFSNKSKSNDKSPDFIIYLSNEVNKDSEPVANKPQVVREKKKVPVPVPDSDSDDQIPEIPD